MAEAYKRKGVELIPQEQWAMVGDQIVALDQQAKQMANDVKKIKDSLKMSMDKAGVVSWETNGGNRIIRVKDSQDKLVKKFDVDRFMIDYPEIYIRYTTDEWQTGRQGSIRIVGKEE